MAFGQPSLTWAPDWTRIDAFDSLVTSYQIDRGRSYELDVTDTGRATVQIADRHGVLDPTNTHGPFYVDGGTQIQPLIQALICRYNPVDDTWHQRFRGFVETWDYTFDPSQQVNTLVVSLTDIFEYLSAIEMLPGSPGFGVAPPVDLDSADQVYYPAERMDVRIIHVLDDSIGPIARADYAVVFSGNVNVKAAVYSPGESAMTAIQEAADAEFPGVSNVFTDKFGHLAVHGREAKFNPAGVLAGPPPIDNTVWDWHRWKAGDGVAANAAGDVAQIRVFGTTRDLSKIINSAIATPHRTASPLTNAEMVGQTVIDSTSIELFGIRSWSALDLITDFGLEDSSGDLAETKKFATYYVDNYAYPQDRVSSIGFRSINPADDRAPAVWRLLADVDISDEVTVTVQSPGGGGYEAVAYYVEGVHETVAPLVPDYDDVTLTLDLSPVAYFTSDPFS